MRPPLRIHVVLHRSILRAMEHDAFHMAQSAAYSGVVALFPALIVAAAIIAVLPDNAPIRSQLGAFFDRMLPPEVLPMLEAYFNADGSKPAPALILAFFVSLTGASAVMSAYMEGVRRANDLPNECWTYLRRRARSLALVPLSLLPLGVASLLVVFGHSVTIWLAHHVLPTMRTEVYVFASIVRWMIALAGSTGLIALIYHMGTPVRQPWRQVLPGAIAATVMWFVSTLIFGLYVTRFANYSQVYGSLGAGIALLFWLNLVSLSIFFGAEFNTQFRLHGHASAAGSSTAKSSSRQ